MLNRREDEAALGDAAALARPGQELGPAGRVYAAFRTLCGPGDPFRPERLAAVAAGLQSSLDPQRVAELVAALREASGGGRLAPIAAAAAAEAVIALPTPRRSRFGLPTPRGQDARRTVFAGNYRRSAESPATLSRQPGAPSSVTTMVAGIEGGGRKAYQGPSTDRVRISNVRMAA